MIDIAFCESRFRQFNKSGDVLRGEVNSDDVGVVQINTYYHQKDALALGFDIMTLEGNMAYGKYLYEKQGTRPWNSSKPCWQGRTNLVAIKN
jgi:hypothetical protein